MRSGSETEWLSEALGPDITQRAQWRPPSGAVAFGIGPVLSVLAGRRALTYFFSFLLFFFFEESFAACCEGSELEEVSFLQGGCLICQVPCLPRGDEPALLVGCVGIWLK